MIILRICFCSLLALLLVALGGNSQTLPQQKNDPVPQLAGPCNWGDITQRGKLLSIKGVDTEEGTWDAEGTILPSGKILLLWTNRDDGKGGPGVYEWDGAELIGTWGYFGQVRLEEDGTLVGDIGQDVVYPR